MLGKTAIVTTEYYGTWLCSTVKHVPL